MWEETKNGWKLSRKWNKTQWAYHEGTLVFGVRQVWGIFYPYRTSYGYYLNTEMENSIFAGFYDMGIHIILT